MNELPLDNITRLCIVDENGRQYDRSDIKIEADIQDAGQTLKLFVSEKSDLEYNDLVHWADTLDFEKATDREIKLANLILEQEL